MNNDEFSEEARKRIKVFLDKQGFSAHGTYVATQNYIELALGLVEPTADPDPEKRPKK